jgi:hypothetical protein
VKTGEETKPRIQKTATNPTVTGEPLSKETSQGTDAPARFALNPVTGVDIGTEVLPDFRTNETGTSCTYYLITSYQAFPA